MDKVNYPSQSTMGATKLDNHPMQCEFDYNWKHLVLTYLQSTKQKWISWHLNYSKNKITNNYFQFFKLIENIEL